ncbi:ABC transporter permease subunit [Ruminococcus sp.]|uniref:ABC transporter permease subunit n=1 Tax=Ruminococcus sp. TaxID=41978 RepID=UPI0026301EDF|nr:ABC transporter permease subunit [Ruminococcus sp.]MDD7555647.1 ABC transporter permease subunit [Ruminococcus sp.]
MKLYRWVLWRTVRTKRFLIAVVLLVLCMLWSGLDSMGLLDRFSYSSSVMAASDQEDESLFQRNWEISNVFLRYSGEYSPQKQQELELEYDVLNLMLRAADYRWLLSQPGKYSASMLYDQEVLIPILAQCDTYSSFYASTEGVVEQAQRIRENADAQDSYTEREAAMLLRAYDRHYPLPFYNTVPSVMLVHRYLNVNHRTVWLVFVVILVMGLMLCGLFSSEHETGSYMMVFSSVRGRGSLFAAKLAVAMTVAVFVSLLTIGIPALMLGICYGGYQGLFAPVQTLSSTFGEDVTLRMCPFRLTNLEYLLLAAGIRTLILCFFAAVCVCCSVLAKKHRFALWCASGISAGLFVLAVYFNGGADAYSQAASRQGVSDMLRLVNPCGLLWPSAFFSDFDVTALGGYPVYRIWIALLCTILSIVLLVLMSYFFYRRRSNA